MTAKLVTTIALQLVDQAKLELDVRLKPTCPSSPRCLSSRALMMMAPCLCRCPPGTNCPRTDNPYVGFCMQHMERGRVNPGVQGAVIWRRIWGQDVKCAMAFQLGTAWEYGIGID